MVSPSTTRTTIPSIVVWALAATALTIRRASGQTNRRAGRSMRRRCHEALPGVNFWIRQARPAVTGAPASAEAQPLERARGGPGALGRPARVPALGRHALRLVPA